MAKTTRDDSLLLKSAESLGRMIGALQRQLDLASRRLVPDVASDGDGSGQRAKRTRTPAAPAARKGKKSKAAGKGLARKAARPR
jgi:hypothetical protein